MVADDVNYCPANGEKEQKGAASESSKDHEFQTVS